MYKHILHTFISGSIVAVLLLIGAALLSPASVAQDEGKDRSMQSGSSASRNMDAKIVANALANDSTEITLTKNALSRIKESKVKDYANMLIDDHEKDAKKLTDVREGENIAKAKADMMPSVKAKVDNEMNRLQSGRSGNNFDISFLQMQIRDHQQAISRMKKAESQASNDQLKSYLKDNLSTLQKHLDKAQSLLKDLHSNQSGK